MNAGLQKFCQKNKICYVDTHSKFADKNGIMREDLSDDGVHPNQNQGYSLLTKLLNAEIEKINQKNSGQPGE